MWEVVGFEYSQNDAGDITSYIVHLSRQFQDRPGCAGRQVKSQWFRPSLIPYVPKIGETVLLELEVRGFGDRKYEALVNIIPV